MRFFAVLLSLFFVIPGVSYAQPQPDVVAPPDSTSTWKRLSAVAVQERAFPGQKGISLAEKQKRWRENVAANTGALAEARAILNEPFIERAPQSGKPEPVEATGRSRELARQLLYESQTRLLDGDIDGALESRQTILRLAFVAASGGVLMDHLISYAVESLAFSEWAPLEEKMNAAQTRSFAAVLAAHDGARPHYSDALRGEKPYALAVLRGQYPTPEARKEFGRALNNALDSPEAPAELREKWRGFTYEKLESSTEALIDEAIVLASWPYSRAKTQILDPTNPINTTTVGFYQPTKGQFDFERNRVRARLVWAALLIRAATLGKEPLDRVRLPADPFGDGPLRFQDGKIYSVGPDGKDDGGTPIQTIVTNHETGHKTVSERVSADSVGDILALGMGD